MGNIPVIKDLIVDMDAVHWKKIQRVTPWLLPSGEPPEREYIVPPESMIDVTQSMACIQCGACVSDCLSMEVDPLFIGPAALAKAYRFVGDPRDGKHHERLRTSSEDEHGIYDCTHCFNCIEACPKGVAPMSQIMRLRRIAGADHGINDRNNGHRHEMAFVKNIEQERAAARGGPAAGLLRRQVPPARRPELLDSLPVILRGAAARQGHARAAPCCKAQGARRRSSGSSRDVHDVRSAYELNLYVTGEEEETRSRRRRFRRAPKMKVAYWPGCVSRGFTPELHGSMAKVAPLLDIELVELDRAACCGAGVIAEHNQELADTLNARTFALAQQEMADGAELMMNICSTCQGAQTECQERLDANSEYRDQVNETLAGRRADLRARHRQQALPVADGRGDRARRDRREGQAAAGEPARRPVLRLLHRPPHQPAGHRSGAPARHATCTG